MQYADGATVTRAARPLTGIDIGTGKAPAPDRIPDTE